MSSAVDVGQQAVEALAAADEYGIVPGDLKPENLFVTPLLGINPANG